MAMLTTLDNPFNPYEDFAKWYDYDCNVLGYNSCAYLSRIVDKLCENSKIKKQYENLNDYDNSVTDLAINEIIQYDPIGIYYKAIQPEKSKNSGDFEVLTAPSDA